MEDSRNYKVLVVDDNAMNRKLNIALLKACGIGCDSAESGREALDKAKENQYQLIFMDYRMPEMDGVETAKRLRRLNDVYKNVPIIALTGDDRPEIRATFEEAGMNDVLLKPIEKESLQQILDKWFPSADIDVAEGIKNCGNISLFENLVEDFYTLIDLKLTKLDKCLAENRLEEFTIEVHALKNSARLIGALELSEDFASLEKLGNAGNMEGVKQETPKVLQSMRDMKESLKSYMEKKDTPKRDCTNAQLIECLSAIQDAVEVFDIDSVDRAMEELSTYEIPQNCSHSMEVLKAYIADVALEDILKITKEIITILEETN